MDWIRNDVFPTYVWETQLTLDTDDLLKHCNQLQRKSKGIILSNMGGWQSEAMTEWHKTPFEPVAKVIIEKLNTIKKEYGYWSQYQPNVVNWWYNVNNNGDYNQSHVHARSFISGSYYIAATTDQGDLILHRNMSDIFIHHMWGVEEETDATKSMHKIQPETNKLVLFPSKEPHSVGENTTSWRRVSISFNTILEAI